ncbi:hypothetical protein [Candidatus Parabeggiatoa sp. HSG14]|uniref:hypothetical protein n=1 Tax=Candidatus Parabeggiatoa sp. HSG14 TaxID=3055593 RepID=UPI0025A7B196|nr:hypothetical protein [Thiotrichales bacterium HSG14]
MLAEQEKKNTLEMNLDTFLRQKKQQQPPIEWENKKQKWLLSVNELYATIEDWLSHLTNDHIVKMSYNTITLDEYYLKPYPVKQLNLLVGYESVQFEPKGMIVVNALGRVDMIGDDGILKLLLRSDDETNNLQWVVAVSTVHSLWFPLTKASFSEALEQVMRKNV